MACCDVGLYDDVSLFRLIFDVSIHFLSRMGIREEGSPVNQEWIVFIIVALNLVWLLVRFYRQQIADPLSQWLLKSGQVKWAMKVRHHRVIKSGCDECKK